VVTRLEHALDELQVQTQHMAEAAQAAMTRQLAESERAARSAEGFSWLAAFGALLLSVLLSALLIGSIVRPLERLTHGTREISAGRFGYRLDETGRDEFAQVAREFNTMTARLDELDRMKREFVSNVSHDLKTPLSSMQETTEVLLEELPGPLSDTQRRLLLLNKEGGQRLAGMIAKLPCSPVTPSVARTPRGPAGGVGDRRSRSRRPTGNCARSPTAKASRRCWTICWRTPSSSRLQMAPCESPWRSRTAR